MSALNSADTQWVSDGIAHLSTLVDSDLPGWSRTGFSEQDAAARDWIHGQMRALGLSVSTDPVGNVIGRLDGQDPNAPDIVIGSHSDTVPGGGRFDGIVGVVGALEVIRMLQRSDVRLRHGLRVVDFSNEEGNPQGVKLVGSRAVAGTLGAQALGATDDEGRTLAELMAAGGRSPEHVASARWDRRDVAAYLELHIEQGPHLEEAGASVGVVTRVCGISTFALEVQGRRDHAGTTPMATRADALCCAADAVLAVQRIGASGTDTVGTVGAVTTSSPLTNTISEDARVTGEFRSPDERQLHELQRALAQTVPELDARHRTRSELMWKTDVPVVMDEALSNLAIAAATNVGHQALRVYSGATHDSVEMSAMMPSAMIFVPSRAGRSHCPEEWTDLVDIGHGVDVLAEAVRLRDQAP
ncbi:M20 family metallo-hydrolase [Ornithinimicrobium pekingense]|uniref:Zn-dependent hydrolase n=1 Tax=Ornithinimicrobium pekingense TaxID=384677 RepID=A0ABQ2F8P3_9MICO|nr:M20 family metallo-hydrolase [Ornithinimicrobium pekingense]GGK63532.1 Zn-dependent hydrolase [Ornithinimicrobium pekingense]